MSIVLSRALVSFHRRIESLELLSTNHRRRPGQPARARKAIKCYSTGPPPALHLDVLHTVSYFRLSSCVRAPFRHLANNVACWTCSSCIGLSCPLSGWCHCRQRKRAKLFSFHASPTQAKHRNLWRCQAAGLASIRFHADGKLWFSSG